MHILTEDGKLASGTPLTEEEMQVYEHFTEHLNGSAQISYIASSTIAAIGRFMLQYYNMSLRKSPELAVETEAENDRIFIEAMAEKLDLTA